MTTILIKADDLTRNTIMGGNIDVDRYLNDIKACQITYIRPLLGKELYDKITLLYETETLSGLYLELYEDYVKELIIHGTTEIYLGHGAYLVTNNGITKNKTESSETVDRNEVDFLVQSSKRLYQLYEREFYTWIKDKDIPEYKQTCYSERRINVGGWSLRKNQVNRRYDGFGRGYY